MTQPHSIRDEDLTAFLDDELDGAAHAAIEAALRQDPLLRQRLDALRLPRDALSSAFDGVAALAPAMPDLPQAGPAKMRAFFPISAAMAACLLIGVLAGNLLSPTPLQRDNWMDYVASYQALYVNETLSGVAQSDAQSTEQLQRLGNVLGRDLSAARSEQALDFKRAQLLGYEGRQLVQLAYLSPTGEPMALCIIRSEASDDTAITTTILEGMSSAHWTRKGFAFLLIGGNDSAFVAQVAERLSSSI